MTLQRNTLVEGEKREKSTNLITTRLKMLAVTTKAETSATREVRKAVRRGLYGPVSEAKPRSLLAHNISLVQVVLFTSEVSVKLLLKAILCTQSKLRAVGYLLM